MPGIHKKTDIKSAKLCSALQYSVLYYAIQEIKMNTMATINIRTDIDTKKKAEQLFADFGLSMTSAINVFLKQVIREKRIPFEIGYEIPELIDSLHA